MNNIQQKIIIMSLGYICLSTSLTPVAKGHIVAGVKAIESTVDTINLGNIYVAEPDLEIIVRPTINNGNLKVSLQLEKADNFILTAPIPFLNNDKQNNNSRPEPCRICDKSYSSISKERNLIILELDCLIKS